MASTFNTPGGSNPIGATTPTNGSDTTGGSGTTGDLGAELRDDAKNLAGTAKQRIQDEVDARKGDAVNQVQSVSSVLGETAQNLGEEAPTWLRSALEQGAKSLDQFARSIEQQDAKALGRDAKLLARNNPGTFLAGCTVAGFVAARIFKAGAQGSSTAASNSSDLGTDRQHVGSVGGGVSQPSFTQPSLAGTVS